MMMRLAAAASPSSSGMISRRSSSSSSSRPIARAAACPRQTAAATRCRPRHLHHPRLHHRHRALPPGSSSGGPEGGEGEGEVYEVVESSDDAWADVALPVTMTSAEGQQVEYLVLDTDGSLAEPAIEAYLGRLQDERDAEAATERAAIADSAAAGGGGGGKDGEASGLFDETLLKRIAAVRDGERGLIVQELLYLLVIKALKDAGLAIVTDLGDAAPAGRPAAKRDEGSGGEGAPALDSGRDTMGQRMERLLPAVSLPVADSILGYVGATVTNSMRSMAKDTPLSIDRVQAARLYGGMLEFGYFSRSLEEECSARGVNIGSDSEAMVRLADSLEEDVLRAMCDIKTADGWYTAIRHTGGLFGLRPNPDLRFDSCALPYAELATTISDIVLEPASVISEHYSPPGTMEQLRRQLQRKQERGWGGPDPDKVAPELPEADLVSFRVGEFGALLVEAGVVGSLIWEAERKIQSNFNYRLEPKATRLKHVRGDDEDKKG